MWENGEHLGFARYIRVQADGSDYHEVAYWRDNKHVESIWIQNEFWSKEYEEAEIEPYDPSMDAHNFLDKDDPVRKEIEKMRSRPQKTKTPS